jgi:hypothetical protein
MPCPRLASDASFWRVLLLGFLQRKVRPPLPGLPAALFALASPSHRAQQFQKNAYHFDKVLISEPMSKPSTGPSTQSLCMKIDSHSCTFFLAVT